MSRELIAEAQTPDGESLTLSKEDGHHVVRVRGELLMSSRQSGSEEVLARIAFEKAVFSTPPSVLVGGLGIGFTLRAILDLLTPKAQVTVVELLDEVVRWNRDILSPYAEHPLQDSRVTVHVADLVEFLAGQSHSFDAIIVDIDNGPEAFTVSGNNSLYSLQGLKTIYGSLRPGGAMVLWSAFTSKRFEKRLNTAGFSATSVVTRARTKARKGARHTVFVAVRPR